jgi:hypothetical protein
MNDIAVEVLEGRFGDRVPESAGGPRCCMAATTGDLVFLAAASGRISISLTRRREMWDGTAWLGSEPAVLAAGGFLADCGGIAREYFIRAEPHEITAHAELRDPGGRSRADLGSFATVALAQAACEADAQRWCRRGPLSGGPGDVRIARGRRG